MIPSGKLSFFFCCEHFLPSFRTLVCHAMQLIYRPSLFFPQDRIRTKTIYIRFYIYVYFFVTNSNIDVCQNSLFLFHWNVVVSSNNVYIHIIFWSKISINPSNVYAYNNMRLVGTPPLIRACNMSDVLCATYTTPAERYIVCWPQGTNFARTKCTFLFISQCTKTTLAIEKPILYPTNNRDACALSF